MFIEEVGLEPPHHYEGVVTIQFKKLLTAEPVEVNSFRSFFGGDFTQENNCYCAKCGKSFHGTVPSLRQPVARAWWWARENGISFDHLVGAGEQRRWHVEAERPGGL
jgi:hypothetical protein